MAFYVHNLGLQRERNKILLEENVLAKLSYAQCEQVTTHINEIRTLKHDINNHLKTLSALIDSGKFSNATNYIATITDDLEKTHNILSSGNIPIDCILSNKKILFAQAQNIKVEYSIHLPVEFPLDSVDTCSLLGNLMDNAIEACNKISNCR